MSVRVLRSIPYVLALVVVLTSMRGLKPLGFKFADASKHMLNGALIYDFVRTGDFAHPMSFAKQFYSRFPAITIPYHPPMFGAIQALFYAAFGVSFFAARLSVAAAAGICTLLLYRLVNHSHRSVWFATAVTLTFMTTSISQKCATDVMPEFPSLAFTLGALYCLRDLETGYPPSRAYPFALLAGAAVWTKQHAVFLGLVPFLFILLRGNWRSLRGLHLWLSSFLFGLIVLAFTLLSVPVSHAGVTQQFARASTLWGTILFNAEHYGTTLVYFLGLVVTCWTLSSTVAFVAIPRLRSRAENDLYLAWILALLPVLLLTANHDMRYAFFGLPALFVLGCDSFRLACKRLLAVRYIPAVSGLVTVCLILYQTCYLADSYSFMTARFTFSSRSIKDRASRRLIYCGEKVSFLAVWLRFLDPDSRTIMIRGNKLDRDDFKPENFEHFAWRYGVDTVVVDTEVDVMPWTRPRYWDYLVVHPTPSMVRDRVLTEPANPVRKILIYEFKNPSPDPESFLAVPISSTAGRLNLSL